MRPPFPSLTRIVVTLRVTAVDPKMGAAAAVQWPVRETHGRRKQMHACISGVIPCVLYVHFVGLT
jgi:hypothetical protein